ncbi:MAG: tRNA glutamyl-Q(34) synthetase GluQRS [Pseudomonadota bacterium]
MFQAQRTFRFAPSPNGALHLGHIYSALCNHEMAKASGGTMLLRIEDIDRERCKPEFERQIFEDLHWLGFAWPEPVRRQSEHLADYSQALQRLRERGLVYPAFLTRRHIREAVARAENAGHVWPRDPDGAPHYPGTERNMSTDEIEQAFKSEKSFAWRLDMQKALRTAGQSLSWNDTGAGPALETGLIAAEPDRWGDVIIARKDTPTSYHLSVVVDDALQNVTDVVRGHDLFHATSVHRLLQVLLELPQPAYHHHPVLAGKDGRKLAKSQGDTAISALRERGTTPLEVIHLCETTARV